MRRAIKIICTATKSGYVAEIVGVDTSQKTRLFFGRVYAEGKRYDEMWNEQGEAQSAQASPFFDVQSYLLKSYSVKRD